jgi:hypothetical protein
MAQSQGGQAVSHIGDTNKMVSDTPRTNNFDWSFHMLFAESQKMERELNAANERIKRLEEENDALRADLLLWREQEVKP